jgi:hypothetical protein
VVQLPFGTHTSLTQLPHCVSTYGPDGGGGGAGDGDAGGCCAIAEAEHAMMAASVRMKCFTIVSPFASLRTHTQRPGKLAGPLLQNFLA